MRRGRLFASSHKTLPFLLPNLSVKIDMPFEVIMSGETALNRQKMGKILPFQEVGASWWVEKGLDFSLEEFSERIQASPLGK